jgi:hypothetical protein
MREISRLAERLSYPGGGKKKKKKKKGLRSMELLNTNGQSINPHGSFSFPVAYVRVELPILRKQVVPSIDCYTRMARLYPCERTFRTRKTVYEVPHKVAGNLILDARCHPSYDKLLTEKPLYKTYTDSGTKIFGSGQRGFCVSSWLLFVLPLTNFRYNKEEVYTTDLWP